MPFLPGPLPGGDPLPPALPPLPSAAPCLRSASRGLSPSFLGFQVILSGPLALSRQARDLPSWPAHWGRPSVGQHCAPNIFEAPALSRVWHSQSAPARPCLQPGHRGEDPEEAPALFPEGHLGPCSLPEPQECRADPTSPWRWPPHPGSAPHLRRVLAAPLQWGRSPEDPAPPRPASSCITAPPTPAPAKAARCLRSVTLLGR